MAVKLQDAGVELGATAYKVRMIYNKWWLRLFNMAGKNVGDYGPLVHAEVEDAVAKAKRAGLADIERDMGSRGR
jgi:hypothetical protein